MFVESPWEWGSPQTPERYQPGPRCVASKHEPAHSAAATHARAAIPPGGRDRGHARRTRDVSRRRLRRRAGRRAHPPSPGVGGRARARLDPAGHLGPLRRAVPARHHDQSGSAPLPAPQLVDRRVTRHPVPARVPRIAGRADPAGDQFGPAGGGVQSHRALAARRPGLDPGRLRRRAGGDIGPPGVSGAADVRGRGAGSTDHRLRRGAVVGDRHPDHGRRGFRAGDRRRADRGAGADVRRARAAWLRRPASWRLCCFARHAGRRRHRPRSSAARASNQIPADHVAQRRVVDAIRPNPSWLCWPSEVDDRAAEGDRSAPIPVCGTNSPRYLVPTWSMHR